MIFCPIIFIGITNLPPYSLKENPVAESAFRCEGDCAWYDKQNKRCCVLSIAKSLDRLHNSQRR